MRLPQQFKCDQCGTVGPWGPAWSWYGSVALSEEAPQHVIHLCSERCRVVMKANIDAGNVVQPEARLRGHRCTIVGQRKGY